MSEADNKQQTAEQGEVIRIVRLPTQLAGMDVIVPYSLVAEITEVVLPEGDTSLSRQEAAMVDWRGLRVPMVSLEVMLNEPLPTIGQRVRCVVLYGTNSDLALPYFALLLSGVPRSEQVTADRFTQEMPGDGPLWQVSADLGGRRAVIPDIRELERRVFDMKLRSEEEPVTE